MLDAFARDPRVAKLDLLLLRFFLRLFFLLEIDYDPWNEEHKNRITYQNALTATVKFF